MDRLDKILSGTGLYSRSEAKVLISEGAVSVNGSIVRRGEEKVSREAVILVRGERIDAAEYVYYMMNKPAEYVCSTKDELYPAITRLLPEYLQKRGLQPVGRLDADVTGLLLLTDDGKTAHKLMSPKSETEKTYEIFTDLPLSTEHIILLADGVVMRDGTQYRSAGLVIDADNAAHGYVTVTEGKYHEVKNLIIACGRHITAMKRIQVGKLALDPSLILGEGRLISPEELALCFC